MATNVDMTQVLAQMRQIAAAAQGAPAPAAGGEPAGGADFAALLKSSIDKVNETQQQAGQLAEAFSAGNPGIDLSEVMVALQKASVSFQAMTQVRNRLVDAYRDIMNMPV
jgi:flagellar hook-basal body complex protein FliE